MSERNDWQVWLAAQRAASTMTAETIPLAATRGWGMTEEAYCRPDGKFFRLIGLRISVPKEGQREVTSWDQPILEEVGGQGAVVLLKAAGEGRYLIATRVEPGNARPGCMLLGAPLQASIANLKQAHGGTVPPRAEFVAPETLWNNVLQDGARFYRKEERHAVVEVDQAAIVLRTNERWFSRDELREAYHAGELNSRLIEVLFAALI